MTAVETGYDLGGLMLCLVALALLLAAKSLAKAIFGLIDIALPIIGHPFHGIVKAVENAAIGALNDAIKGTERIASKFFYGIVDSLGILVGLVVLLGEGIKLALTYLWHTAFSPRVVSITRTEISRLNIPRIDVKAITSSVVATVTATFAPEIAAARTAASRAEAAAKAAAKDAANAAEKAKGTVVNDITNIVTEPTTYVTNAVTEVVPGLAEALTAAGEEVAQLPGLVLPDIRGLLNNQDLATLGGLMAAIPLLRALTSTIASETGLENAECRAKVKGICATDPSAWANLLGGLVAVGVAFNLRELYGIAEPLVADLAPIIREAA